MRPQIICHMLSSIDGRLDTDYYSLPHDDKDINEVMNSYFTISDNYQADAILIGRKTVQKHSFQETYQHTGSTTNDFEPFIGLRDSSRLTIVVDPMGKILYTDNQMDGENIVTILGKGVSHDYTVALRAMGISYVFAGEDGNDIVSAMETLYEAFGMKKILLEGGGIINGAFLEAQLIDEMSLMIYPGIDGQSKRPSIFEYLGEINKPANGQTLEFVSTEVLNDGIVYVNYKFHHNKQ